MSKCFMQWNTSIIVKASSLQFWIQNLILELQKTAFPLVVVKSRPALGSPSWWYGCLFGCHNAKNGLIQHGCWLPPSDHAHICGSLFQTHPDQKWQIMGQTSFLHSWVLSLERGTFFSTSPALCWTLVTLPPAQKIPSHPIQPLAVQVKFQEPYSHLFQSATHPKIKTKARTKTTEKQYKDRV